MSEAVGRDPYARSRGEIIAERGTVVPPWAPSIRDFTVTVKKMVDGEPKEISPSFTIGDVAPEYRWAINPDTGVIKSQPEFRQDYEKWYVAHYTMQGAKVEGDVTEIPNVEEFVSRRVDPNDTSKIVPMNHDSDRPIVSKVKPIHDRDGEVLSEERLAELEGRKEADALGAKMKQLVEMLASGDISNEVFVKRSTELYGGSVVVGSDSPDSDQPVSVEPPTGFEQKAEDEPEPETEPEPEMTLALCGKEVKVRGKHLHELRCKACEEVRNANIESEETPQEE